MGRGKLVENRHGEIRVCLPNQSTPPQSLRSPLRPAAGTRGAAFCSCRLSLYRGNVDICDFTRRRRKLSPPPTSASLDFLSGLNDSFAGANGESNMHSYHFRMGNVDRYECDRVRIRKSNWIDR